MEENNEILSVSESVQELYEAVMEHQADSDFRFDSVADQLDSVLDTLSVLVDDDGEDFDLASNDDILDAIVALNDALMPEDGEEVVTNAQLLEAVDNLGIELSAFYNSIYNGQISGTVLDYFDRFSYKLSFFDDYLLYRSGQYEYTLVYGDLDLSGTTFSGDALHSVRLNTYTSNFNDYVWSVSDNDSLVLNVGTKPVYSNLGSYPTLDRQSDFLPLLVLLVLVVFGLVLIVRPVFQFVLRPSAGSGEGVSRHDTASV